MSHQAALLLAYVELEMFENARVIFREMMDPRLHRDKMLVPGATEVARLI
jgi:hypothetical protein